MELRYSCMKVATPEASFTLRGATKVTLQDRRTCPCHEKWLSWSALVTHETSSTLRGATGVSLQHHHTLHLPRKMTVTIDPQTTWNVQYNKRRNRSHPAILPNTAPATKNDSHDWSSSNFQRAKQQVSVSNIAWHEEWLPWLIFLTYQTPFTMHGATGVSLQHHQILCLPPKMTFLDLREILRNRLNWTVIYNKRPIRPWSENDLTMNPSVRNPSGNWGYFSRWPRTPCVEKCNISRSGYHSKLHRILRLAIWKGNFALLRGLNTNY